MERITLANYTPALLTVTPNPRSVLIVSSHHELLFPCLESLKAIIFPLSWNHIYIPVMSTTMSQQLQVPFPYLAGVSKCEEVFENIKLENSVVVDLDDDGTPRLEYWNP